MERAVTVYYSLASPWSYLGWVRLREIARRAGASVLHRPIDMRPVFQASGGLPLGQRPRQRQAYRLMELRRWRERLGLPLNLEPRHFPTDERPAARMVIAHGWQGGDISRLSESVLHAVWVGERDIADPTTLRALAAENGADVETLAGMIEDDEVKAEYRANTQAAVDAGVFGVPTYVVGDELFWGQDRLDFVERALR